MPNYMFIVPSTPLSPDIEDAYNQWYTNDHIQQVLQVEGVVAATRYKLASVQGDWLDMADYPFGQDRYIVVYEVDEAADPAVVLRAIRDAGSAGRFKTPWMEQSPMTIGPAFCGSRLPSALRLRGTSRYAKTEAINVRALG